MREDTRRGAPRSRGPAAPAARVAPAGPAGPAPDAARVKRLLEPVLRALDLDLEDIRISSAGRRRVLRVIVDGDGGVSLDEIAEVSREISAKLDSGSAMGDAPYTLEVSSPGVERPLTAPRHWRRAAGRLVVVLPAAAGGARDGSPATLASITGRVVGADDRGVTLDVDGESRTFGYGELGPGRVQVEYGRLADESGLEEEEPDGH